MKFPKSTIASITLLTYFSSSVIANPGFDQVLPASQINTNEADSYTGDNYYNYDTTSDSGKKGKSKKGESKKSGSKKSGSKNSGSKKGEYYEADTMTTLAPLSVVAAQAPAGTPVAVAALVVGSEAPAVGSAPFSLVA